MAAALAVGAASGGATTPAAALFGDVEIKPIESNIAERPWASVEAGSGADSSRLAIDQNADTAWIAADSGAQWLTLDLGGIYDNIRKVEVVFPDSGAVYQYVVEASGDGDDWTVIADRSDNAAPGRGGVELLTRPDTRYIRVTITGTSPGATVGVSEISAYNYLRDDVVLGADLSYIDDFQNRQYWVHPLEEDRGAGPFLLDVAQDRGMELVRLRIFNEPRSESSGSPVNPPRQGPERSLQSAKWIKERGLELAIDFHYSDSWADPGKQAKPRAWAELPFDELVDAVYGYTHDYIRQLVDQGTTPDKVAIGNEVNNGFLWGSEAAGMTTGPVVGTANPAYFRNQPGIYQSQPGGGLLWPYMNSDDPVEQRLYSEAFDRFAELQAAGIRAVRDASPSTLVEIHSLTGSGIGPVVGPGVGNQEISGIEKAMEMWSQTLSRLEDEHGVFPDIIGQSYYPEYHGTMEQLEHNLHTVASAYPEVQLVVAETSYPASGGGGAPMPNAIYPRTIQGQADAIQRVFQATNDVINNQGKGVLTWEPASWQSMFRSVPGMANTFEPHSSIDIYNKSRATHVMEDRVYRTVLVGAEPALPETVQVLTTADGSIASVPVDWDEVSADGTDTTGRVAVSGSTEFGGVTALVDVIDDYVTPACGERVSGRHLGPLTIDSGVTCIERATIAGPVTVGPGASVVITNGQVTGPVTSQGDGVVVVCGTRVTGPLTIQRASSVTLGNPIVGCEPNTVTGPVSVNDVSGWNVIAGNRITGPLACSGNDPAPVNNGSINTAGRKSGQCAGL
ncbi:glycosyl hydrolase 53 family protein [Jiangella aurantiaca]|uniref:glycosyl hydrolase 53 family protein n=1 Tax=Jiangella aurantiaca TaxID=2530373 RepID=UPI0013A5BF25|nr:glycosyl hydrolase 53 family protein [Jiangella aurantiaca]